MCARKNDPNQLDWFASMPEQETPPASPGPDPASPPDPVAPAPKSPSDDTPVPSEPDIAPFEEDAVAPPAPSDDTSFNPAEWEDQPEEPLQQTPPPDPVPADQTPAPETSSADFDPFASDPFFNPESTQPSATPEELLLNRIVPPPRPPTGASLNEAEIQDAVRARQQAELELESSRRELAALQARCASLETERNAAVAEAGRERQLRAEAAAAHRARTVSAPLTHLSADMQPTRHTSGGDIVSRRTLHLALLGALVLCIAAYLTGRGRAPSPVTILDSESAPPQTEIAPAALPAAPAPAAEPSVAPAWPALGVKDCRVTGEDNTRLVVFQYGVFTRGVTLAPAARQDLARIAAALKPVIASFQIEVEGHTDSSPVRGARAYADNHELGLARATAAAEFLTAQCGLPADAIAATSAGDSHPPHPGNDPETQRRNRTVVLKITRR